MAAGEVAQRIEDMPRVADMVESVVKETEEIILSMPKKFIVS
jgi:hypothetical protein